MPNQIPIRIVGLVIFGFFALRTYQLIQRMQEQTGAQFKVSVAIAAAFIAIAIIGLIMAFRTYKAAASESNDQSTK